MTETRDTSTAPRVPSVVARGVVVAVLSLLLGVLTYHAQGFLPDALTSFANSASGWTLLTATLVYAARLRPVPAALLGPVSFVLLTVGYAIGADLDGLHYDPLRFSLVGLVAGPVVGVSTAWLRDPGTRAALGTAVLAGIGVGEAVYGLTEVRETTAPAYWVVIGLAALALLVSAVARRTRGPRDVALAVGGTAFVATCFVVLYRLL